jgi:cyclase
MSLNRRQFLASSSVALVVSALDWRTLLAQDGPWLQPDALIPVRRSIGTFIGQGGTIGWHIDAKSVVVVDSQFPATAKTCLDAVNARTGSRRLDYLVNTHHHADHTGGNPVFRPVAQKILAQANVPRLQMEAAARAAQAAQGASPGQPPQPEQVVADTTFDTTWRAPVGDEVMALKYYGPAHTSGDAVVTFEKANVAHVGDLVFNRRHPYIDRPAGASIANWIKVVEGTVADHDGSTIYIFGHASPAFPPTGGRADLLYMRDYLTALLDFVRGEMKAGKSKEIIVKITDPLKGFPDHGPLVERVLTAAYEELA